MITSALIWYGVRAAWGWVAPYLAPLTLAAGFIKRPSLKTVRMVVIGCLIAAGLGYSIFKWLNSPPKFRPAMVAVSDVEANRLKAELDAERSARVAAETNARFYEDLAQQHRQEIADLTKRNRDLRNETLNRTDAVLPADDPWLREKAARAH